MSITQEKFQELLDLMYELAQPHCTFVPEVYRDEDKWYAQYKNQIIGVGDSPGAAVSDYDKKWYQRLGIK